MRRRAWGVVAAAVVGIGLSASSASAQVVHSLNLSVGGFIPKAEDARVANDVWLADLPVFKFEVVNFRGPEVSGEWNLAFGPHVEIGLGGAYYQRSVPMVYRDYVNKDRSEIRSDFKLRLIPAQAVVRFLPFGKPGRFQPYVGAGLGLVTWRYSEVGDFIDFNDNYNVYRARYVADGTSAGPVLLAGFRAPLGGDIYALTFEGRYQGGEGTLNTNDFLDKKIDLGGTSWRVGFLIRF